MTNEKYQKKIKLKLPIAMMGDLDGREKYYTEDEFTKEEIKEFGEALKKPAIGSYNLGVHRFFRTRE